MCGTRPLPAGQPGEQRSFRIRTEFDSIWVSAQAHRYARQLGFDRQALGEISIVVAELVSNVVKFAGKGDLTLRKVSEPAPGLSVVVEDRGPGIDDASEAVRDGYSEGKMIDPDEIAMRPRRGLGTGLGAVRRLTDVLQIEKRPGGGTRIVAYKATTRRKKGH
jgi:serine/threonine-protein kinase RsbT